MADTTVTTTVTAFPTTLPTTTTTSTVTITQSPSTATLTTTVVETLTQSPSTVTTTTTAVSTTTLAPSTVTTTAVSTTTLAPSTVTTTQTLTAPTVTATTTAPTVTVVMTETTPASTVTQVVATTVTTGPVNTHVAASLIVDGTVQLTGPRTFELTGSVEPKKDIVQIEFYDNVDGRTHDLGAAALSKHGTFTFSDHVARGTQSFITAVATDAAGRTSSVAVPFSLFTGFPDAQSGPRQDRYDPVTDAYTGSTVFYKDGAPKTVTSVAADGTPLLTVHFRPDGSSVTEIQAPGQTVTSSASDTFNTSHQPDTTFVFNPGFGQDVIHQFRLGGKGHDTLSLPSADFTSLVDVLHHTKNTPHGAVIHDPVSDDTIKLTDISKEILKENQDDIKFHG